MDITIISALIGGIIGGLCSGAIALWTFKKNRNALIIGVTHGIYTEINTLWSIYEIKFKDAIEILEDEKFLNDNYLEEKYPLYLYPHYFVVYDSNCSHIGQIPNNELRADIVTGYLSARELSDAYLHNNDLLKDLDRLTILQRQTTDNIYDKDIEAVKSALKKHFKYIVKVHNKVKKFYLTVNTLLGDSHENRRDLIGDGRAETDERG